MKELSELDGVSGNEKAVRDYIASQIKDKVDEFKIDVLGNLIALKKGTKSRRKILLAAHMDEVGFMVTNIEEDGTLSFAPVGGVEPQVVIGKKVRIEGKINGVIGYKAIHLQKKEQLLNPPTYEQLRIYIGAKSKDEASKLVKIGDYVAFATKYLQENDRATGKAFDDRVGCSVLMDIIDKKERYEDDVYFAFLVQEETGLRGSAVVVEQIFPDIAIVIEGTTAGDDPELPSYQWATHLGDGPAITFMHRGYVVSRKIYEAILSVARKYGIKHQEKRRTAGGTDARRFATTAYGVPSGVISVPARYIHSPICMIDLKDYENTVLLVQKILQEGEEFAK
ncbi:peptidase M42 family protein [Pseudothermotoga thermarum DSM 5069]|uniref:Peptidase M42 family protein n=1 Tax=Pseudothermotoga thermarum DSM 5069 TaxID=688269 RepID=F7YU89_9THEM|nr:peptidase M42 family protein [Pseudothermotoga thermarum DSM 5069]